MIEMLQEMSENVAATSRPSAKKKPAAKAAMTPRLDVDRISEILDVATEIFIEQGFQAASTNEIARRANSSKTTLYSRFFTKKDLFVAVIERRMDLMFSQFSAALPPDRPMRTTLTQYGAKILELALSEKQLALARVVSMESRRFPELGERFFALGPGRGLRSLSGYFEEQIKAGRLRNESPATMADQLISMMTGGYVRWSILGLKLRVDPKEKQKRLEDAVETFLRAYAVRPKSKK